ncbi:MAG: NYN domain-containing protein [bacterium]|nr:NYN domain-containing protein [bacterium]
MRVSVYIDGGNFYHLVIKKLDIEENNFDFDTFANFLIDGRAVSESSKRFYKGSIPEKEGDPRSKELMSKQTKLFTILKKSGWNIKTSKLRTRVEELVVDSRVSEYQKLKKIGIEKIHTERMREKGIDVKIATDLLVGAFDDKYDTAIIVSSDSDLVPAIDWVRNRKKKKVEYIGFSIPDLEQTEKSTKPLMMMFSKTDVQRVFSDVEMRKFIKPLESTLFSQTKEEMS